MTIVRRKLVFLWFCSQLVQNAFQKVLRKWKKKSLKKISWTSEQKKNSWTLLDWISLALGYRVGYPLGQRFSTGSPVPPLGSTGHLGGQGYKIEFWGAMGDSAGPRTQYVNLESKFTNCEYFSQVRICWPLPPPASEVVQFSWKMPTMLNRMKNQFF